MPIETEEYGGKGHFFFNCYCYISHIKLMVMTHLKACAWNLILHILYHGLKSQYPIGLWFLVLILSK